MSILVTDPDYNVVVSAEAAFIASRSDPASGQYFFAYRITIRNAGNIPAKLLTRHWIITHGDGHAEEVKGEGVVGEQPHLRPREAFEYTSAAVLPTPIGTMHGTYGMLADDGHTFFAPIPVFRLLGPGATLH